MLTVSEQILVKVESTKGVDAIPVPASDAVLVSNPSWKLEGLEMIERGNEVGSGASADRQSIFGNSLKTVTFDVKLRGSGVAGTPPEVSALLHMCAMSENIVPATSVTYQPVSDFDTQETGTVYFRHEGLVHKLTGCVGTYSATLETNNVIMLSFTISGHSNDPVNDTYTAGTFDTTVPPVIAGNAFDVGGYGAVISNLSFDYGALVAMPKDMSSSDGYGVLGITRFSPNGSFDPLMVNTTTNDFMGDLRSGANLALTTGVIGSVVGNRIQMSMPAIYYVDAGPGDRDGFRTYEMPYKPIDVSGDDFVSFSFT